jgi:hypothetical protein
MFDGLVFDEPRGYDSDDPAQEGDEDQGGGVDVVVEAQPVDEGHAGGRHYHRSEEDERGKQVWVVSCPEGVVGGLEEGEACWLFARGAARPLLGVSWPEKRFDDVGDGVYHGNDQPRQPLRRSPRRPHPRWLHRGRATSRQAAPPSWPAGRGSSSSSHRNSHKPFRRDSLTIRADRDWRPHAVSNA